MLFAFWWWTRQWSESGVGVEDGETTVGGVDGGNIHGEILSSVELYCDAEDDDWKKDFPPLPEARSNVVAGAVDDFLIVCGGLKSIDPEEVSGKCWALVGSRHEDVNKWLVIPSLPVPVAMSAAVVVDQGNAELWVFGGINEENEDIDQIQIYNPTKGWRIEQHGLGVKMSKHVAALHEDWVYLIHGENAHRYSVVERRLEDLPSTGENFENAGAGLAQIDGGDALVVAREDCVKWIGLPYMKGEAGERDSWNQLFNLPADKEKNPMVATIGDTLYVGGGADSDSNAQDSVFKMSGAGKPWETGARPLASKRHSHATVLLKPGW